MTRFVALCAVLLATATAHADFPMICHKVPTVDHAVTHSYDARVQTTRLPTVAARVRFRKATAGYATGVISDGTCAWMDRPISATEPDSLTLDNVIGWFRQDTTGTTASTVSQFSEAMKSGLYAFYVNTTQTSFVASQRLQIIKGRTCTNVTADTLKPAFKTTMDVCISECFKTAGCGMFEFSAPPGNTTYQPRQGDCRIMKAGGTATCNSASTWAVSYVGIEPKFLPAAAPAKAW